MLVSAQCDVLRKDLSGRGVLTCDASAHVVSPCQGHCKLTAAYQVALQQCEYRPPVYKYFGLRVFNTF
jgi:hypothetical protein